LRSNIHKTLVSCCSILATKVIDSQCPMTNIDLAMLYR
jgi:hypothetical protein